MPDLTASSQFTQMRIYWGAAGYVYSFSYRLDGDTNSRDFHLYLPKNYIDLADDHPLTLMRENYETNDGLLDTDGNKITLTVENFTHEDDDITVEDLTEFGSFNPFVEEEFDNWLDLFQIEGAHIRESVYSEHTDTGKPRITSPIDDIPARRRPAGDTYDYPLRDADWIIFRSGNDIVFRRDFDESDGLSTDDINADYGNKAFLAWLETFRSTGVAVGENIADDTHYNNRNYELDQSDEDGDTIGMTLSTKSVTTTYGSITQIQLTFQRISFETLEFNTSKIRKLFTTATGSIDAEDDQEATERGSTDISHKVAWIEFPNNLVLRPKGNRLTVEHPDIGVLALDGASVKSGKYATLEEYNSNTQRMPNDGTSVIHFGHAETADGNLRFRNLFEHLLTDGFDGRFRVHNVSNTYKCKVLDNSGGNLITLNPGQQCSFLVGFEEGGSGGEIIGYDVPNQNLIWSRGTALGTWAGGTSWTADSATWRSLPITSNSVNRIDGDSMDIGTANDPSSGTIGSVSVADWDIKGSFRIKKAGWVNINNLFYRLNIISVTGQTLSGEFANGNGVSLWVSEGGTGTLTRKLFIGLDPFGGIGATEDYSITYRDYHTANTRFVLLHRVPNGSTFAAEDADGNSVHPWGHVDMEVISSGIVLEPTIRKVVSA